MDILDEAIQTTNDMYQSVKMRDRTSHSALLDVGADNKLYFYATCRIATTLSNNIYVCKHEQLDKRT